MSERNEKVWRWIAWKLPRRLVYWCFVRLFSEATVTTHSDKCPDDVSWKMAMESWETSP